MIVFIMLLVFVAAVFFSGVFSGSETGLYCVSPIRLKVGAARGDRRARRLERLLRNNQAALSLTLVGTNLSNYVATACFAFLISTQLDFSEREAEVYTTLIVALTIFIFGEVVPKNLFQAHPDRLMSTFSPLLRVANAVLYPAVGVLTLLTTRFTAMFADRARIEARLDPRKQIARLLRPHPALSPVVG